ncbi:Glycylpeptide N-tetradecanoyltransferase 2 [Astathelohania contejeani]|uniref:Glycylpeptide N-tetradecanoyltransferase n=1 Tax=Astathelohania contejeani TaxID=164912 RepID=A0ABQ7I0I2_9MICR|nr:Glycylpeptide N-tetradecanoyltransferase 2 [Thelohania contejeani]
MPEQHRFWDRQPVGIGNSNEPIEPPKSVPSNPIELPSGFSFDTLCPAKELISLHKLLSEHYVEHPKSEFRLFYSVEFLKWQLNAPGVRPEYAVTVKYAGEIVGFTLAREHTVQHKGVIRRVVSVNFLCLTRNLRKRRLAPVIIREVTRRANKNGIFQAIFTGGIKLPFSFSTSQYFHFPIDGPELVKLGYMRQYHSQRKLNAIRPGTRTMEERDIDRVMELYKKSATKYSLYEIYNKEEFKYNFLTRPGVINTYVHEENGVITEFGSFYHLNSLIIGKNIKEIPTAYLYIYSTDNHINFIEELIALSSKEGCILFNCLDIMQNKRFIKDLNFLPGDGFLNYYFFNCNAEIMDSSDIGFILV